MAAVAFFLQHDLAVVVQHFLPFAHFFFFFPLSANAIPVTINAAVANKNTFFILIAFFCYVIHVKVA
jgi:hypothetical protein